MSVVPTKIKMVEGVELVVEMAYSEVVALLERATRGREFAEISNADSHVLLNPALVVYVGTMDDLEQAGFRIEQR